ncbi:hypothetical protein Tco_0510175, partial [Tanacetum coccineum]
SEALGHDQPAVPSEHMEEREEEEVPLRRKRSVYRRARTEFNTSAFAQFHAPLSTVPTSAAMDSAGSHRASRVSPFADSADSSSPSLVSTDHIPIDVLFEPTSGGINEFFLD